MAEIRGIGSYVSYNATGEGVTNIKESVSDFGSGLKSQAKKMVGIEDAEAENKIKNDSEYKFQQSTDINVNILKSSIPVGHDIRAIPQTFRKPGVDNTNISKSYLMSRGDFLYCDFLDMSVTADYSSKPLIQNMVITEFQPYEQIFVGQAISRLLPGLSKVLEEVGKVAAGLGDFGLRALWRNRFIKEIAKDPAAFYSDGVYDSTGNYIGGLMETDGKEQGSRINVNNWLGSPMKQIYRLFNAGFWLNTYEVPFYGNNYLEASKAGTWSQEGSSKSLTAGGAALIEGFGIYFPTTPNWEIDIKNAPRDEMTIEFYLINKNEEWMLKNFKFLHSIFSGTQFVSMQNCIVQSPNVYNIVVPGRFEIIWATLSANVTAEGKLRKCSYMNDQLNNNLLQNGNAIPRVLNSLPTPWLDTPTFNAKPVATSVFDTIKTVFKDLKSTDWAGLKSINKNTLWPDAWKLTLTIKDLTMNNFNTYANYHTYGHSAARLAANTNEEDAATLVENEIKELTEAYKTGGAEAAAKLVSGQTLGAFGNLKLY